MFHSYWYISILKKTSHWRGGNYTWHLHLRQKTHTLQGTNIFPTKALLKMIFLFPRWDMLIPWRVYTHVHVLMTSIWFSSLGILAKILILVTTYDRSGHLSLVVSISHSCKWKKHLVTLAIPHYQGSRFGPESKRKTPGDQFLTKLNYLWRIVSENVEMTNLQPWLLVVPSRELTYPTWGKGKSSSKSHFWGDMLVPWKVYFQYNWGSRKL